MIDKNKIEKIKNNSDERAIIMGLQEILPNKKYRDLSQKEKEVVTKEVREKGFLHFPLKIKGYSKAAPMLEVTPDYVHFCPVCESENIEQEHYQSLGVEFSMGKCSDCGWYDGLDAIT